MFKKIGTFFVVLILFAGCNDVSFFSRQNPYIPYFVPTPMIDYCNDAQSAGTKTGYYENFDLKPGNIWLSKCKLDCFANVFSISIKSAGSRVPVIIGIYDNSGNLLTTPVTFYELAEGWNIITISSVTISPGFYWLAIQPENELNVYAVNNEDVDAMRVYQNDTFSLPSKLSPFLQSTNWSLMAYFDYCPQ